MQNRTQAFTVTELLAVTAITAILAAVLIPSTRSIVQRAQAAQCLNNLRQVAMGLNRYADENNQTYPLGGNDATAAGASAWYMSIAPYLGIDEDQMGLPPKARAVGPLICATMKPLENRSSSYGINIYMMKNLSFSHRWGYRRSAVPSLSQTILVGEKNYNTDQVYPEDYGTTRSAVEWRHDNGANFAMLDGHVEYIKKPLPSSDPRWKWW